MISRISAETGEGRSPWRDPETSTAQKTVRGKQARTDNELAKLFCEDCLVQRNNLTP